MSEMKSSNSKVESWGEGRVWLRIVVDIDSTSIEASEGNREVVHATAGRWCFKRDCSTSGALTYRMYLLCEDRSEPFELERMLDAASC